MATKNVVHPRAYFEAFNYPYWFSCSMLESRPTCSMRLAYSVEKGLNSLLSQAMPAIGSLRTKMSPPNLCEMRHCSPAVLKPPIARQSSYAILSGLILLIKDFGAPRIKRSQRNRWTRWNPDPRTGGGFERARCGQTGMRIRVVGLQDAASANLRRKPGLSDGRFPGCREWGLAIIVSYDAAERQPVFDKVLDRTAPLAQERMQRPDDNPLSRIALAVLDRRHPTFEEHLVVLFMARLDTVVNAMPVGTSHPAAEPALRATLRDDPFGIASATPDRFSTVWHEGTRA